MSGVATQALNITKQFTSLWLIGGDDCDRNFNPFTSTAQTSVDLRVKGGAEIHKNLCVTGNIFAETSVSTPILYVEMITNGSSSPDVLIAPEGNVDIIPDMGWTNICSPLNVKGNIDIVGNVDIFGTLTTFGNVVIQGETTDIISNVNIEGNTHIDGEVTIEGNTHIDGEVTIEGNTYIDGEVTIEGNISIDGYIDMNCNNIANIEAIFVHSIYGKSPVEVFDNFNMQNVKITWEYGIEIGNLTTVANIYAISIGKGTKASTINSISIGTSANASIGTHNISIGPHSSSTGQQSIGFGHESFSNGFCSIAMGSGAYADQDDEICLGNIFPTSNIATARTWGQKFQDRDWTMDGNSILAVINEFGNIEKGNHGESKMIGNLNMCMNSIVGVDRLQVSNIFGFSPITMDDDVIFLGNVSFTEQITYPGAPTANVGDVLQYTTSGWGPASATALSVVAVGTIVSSMLTEAQFQMLNGADWVLMDGGNVAGSLYETVTGFSTVPDARGTVLRGKNNARADGFENPAGDLALGTFENDQFQGHWHANDPNADGGAEGFAGGGNSGNGFNVTTFATTIVTDGVNGTPRFGLETRVKSITVNHFIKIN